MRNHVNELGWRQKIGVKSLVVLAGLLTLLLISGIACDDSDSDSVSTATPALQPTATPEPTATSISTPTPRPTATAEPERLASDATEEELTLLARGNTDFALDLYHALGMADGNLFYSPYSISLALAMAYAGARAETEHQMADTLHFSLPQDRLHPAFNDLDLNLASQGEENEGFRLNIANALWGQSDYEFMEQFLEVLERYYGASVRLMDFRTASEPSRRMINDWVADETEDKIKDLIPKGGINLRTRMVITNAIYFDADWLYSFDEENTELRRFHLLNGREVRVPTMHVVEDGIGYADGQGYQAVELPYSGSEMSMIVVLPNEGRFRDFESSMDATLLKQIRNDMQSAYVSLEIPRFEFTSGFELAETLQEMGMPTPFDKSQADFSGMGGKSCPEEECLFISDVIHKAFVLVDEGGTEAAAATAVVVIVREKSMDEPRNPILVRVNRPFMFFILDRSTDTLLFVGRIEELEGESP